jgi:hypothetical protein
MDAKVLNLIEGNGLVFRGHGVWRLVIWRVCAKSADFDFARSHGAHGIDNNGEEWVFVLLVHQLRVHVDPRQPASVARVTVIPACLGFRV